MIVVKRRSWAVVAMWCLACAFVWIYVEEIAGTPEKKALVAYFKHRNEEAERLCLNLIEINEKSILYKILMCMRSEGIIMADDFVYSEWEGRLAMLSAPPLVRHGECPPPFTDPMKEFLPTILRYARQNNARAQNFLVENVWVPSWRRIKLITKAAELGNALAQYRLGMLHYSGRGFTLRLAPFWAESFYKLKSVENYFYASENLRRIKETPEKAFGWFRKAADQGAPKAQLALGWLYLLGDGTEQNSEEGEAWLLRAAGRGYGEAQMALADVYLEGQYGIGQNDKKAAEWFRRGRQNRKGLSDWDALDDEALLRLIREKKASGEDYDEIEKKQR